MFQLFVMVVVIQSHAAEKTAFTPSHRPVKNPARAFQIVIAVLKINVKYPTTRLLMNSHTAENTADTPLHNACQAGPIHSIKLRKACVIAAHAFLPASVCVKNHTKAPIKAVIAVITRPIGLAFIATLRAFCAIAAPFVATVDATIAPF